MIVSHKHKFIFVKTMKTAGTSVEISLSRYCGTADVITPLFRADEAVRSAVGGRPQNYTLNTASGEIQWYSHIPARDIRDLLSPKIWNEYYKFCFDRNPWDKLISMYYFELGIGRIESSMSFNEYVLRRGRAASNFPLYTAQRKVIVDYVGKYETLIEDLRTICHRIGVLFDDWLPKAKGAYRSDRRPYQEVYTKAQRDIVSLLYQDEIDLLGYDF